MKTTNKYQQEQFSKKEITRKEAIKKAGKYAALTATGLFAILNPKDSQAQSSSPERPPNWSPSS